MAENKEVVITYDTLFDIFRREKFRKELQQLDPKFFEDVVRYLNDKQAILKSQEEKDSIFSEIETEKTRTQLANAKKLLKDIYETREAKIVQMALFYSRSNGGKIDMSAMLPEEKELFNDICRMLTQYRKDILGELIACKLPKPKSLKTAENKKSESIVRFKIDVPRFMGSDMNAYGPFKEGDTAALPTGIAEMLINNGHATMEG